MPAVRRYAYLHARTSGLSKRLLSQPRLRELTEENLDGASSALTAAGLPLEESSEALRPGRLEQYATKRLAEETLALLRGVTGSARSLLRHWARRFDLVNFKVIVRGKLGGWTAERIERHLLDLGAMASLPSRELIECEGVDEMLRYLRGGFYADMATQALLAEEQGGELFDAEAGLDRGYLSGLMDEVDRQPRGERAALLRFLGPHLDRHSLVWLLRYRFTLGLNPSHAYFLLEARGQYLTRTLLASLAREESVDAVLAQLPEPLKAQLPEAAGIGEIDRALLRRELRAAAHVLRHEPFRLGRSLAYLLLREQQLNQLQGIVKGARFELPPEDVREAVLAAQAQSG